MNNIAINQVYTEWYRVLRYAIIEFNSRIYGSIISLWNGRAEPPAAGGSALPYLRRKWYMEITY